MIGYNQMSGGAIIIWKFDWSWRLQFQGGSYMWLTIWYWLLIRGLSCLTCGPFHRAFEFSNSMVTDFSKSKESKGRAEASMPTVT